MAKAIPRPDPPPARTRSYTARAADPRAARAVRIAPPDSARYRVVPTSARQNFLGNLPATTHHPRGTVGAVPPAHNAVTSDRAPITTSSAHLTARVVSGQPRARPSPLPTVLLAQTFKLRNAIVLAEGIRRSRFH